MLSMCCFFETIFHSVYVPIFSQFINIPHILKKQALFFNYVVHGSKYSFRQTFPNLYIFTDNFVCFINYQEKCVEIFPENIK